MLAACYTGKMMHQVLRATKFAMRHLPNPPKKGQRVLETEGWELPRKGCAGPGRCVGRVPLLLVVILLISYGVNGSKGGRSGRGPIVTIAVRPRHCFARTVTKSGFSIVDVMPGNDDPRACSPAPRRLISLKSDGTCLHVNCVNFRRM